MDPLPVDFRQGFLDELLAAERYVGRYDARRGRLFTDAVLNFVYNIIAPHPAAFPGYVHPLLPDRPLRRAIYQRQYVLLYEVTEASVTMVYLHYAGRDISQTDLGLAEK